MISYYITPDLIVAHLLAEKPQVIPVFLRHHMSCVGCDLSLFETLADAAHNYDIPIDRFINELYLALEASTNSPPP
jgi:hybrid cluster-associated redox disulfide protein